MLYKFIKYAEWKFIKLVSYMNYFRFIFKIIKNKKRKKVLREMRENLIRDKVCYIVLGGESAKDFNFESLENRDVITVNHFFKTPYYKRLNPKFHVITDEKFYLDQSNLEELNKCLNKDTVCIVNGRFQVSQLFSNNLIEIFPIWRVTRNDLKIDLSEPCSNFSTVGLAAIQVAIFFEYTEINLIGFDLPPGKFKHFYDESRSEQESRKRYQDITDEFAYCQRFWQYTNCHHEAYELARYARKIGIKIINRSETSYLRAFERP
jgi:hypothetical protein